MEPYVTLRGEGSASLEIKKSEFIGYAAHVKSEEEARAFVDKIRKKHADARHNVYAYLLSENNIMRYSDDGEPQGTGGLPVLDILRKSGLTDAVIVVTRYFGGILLGTGGLVRAYSAAAKAAVEEAGRAVFVRYEEYLFTMSYPLYQRFPQLVKNFPVILDSTDFGADVTVRLAIREGFFASMEGPLNDMGAGKIRMEKCGERLDVELAEPS